MDLSCLPRRARPDGGIRLEALDRASRRVAPDRSHREPDDVSLT